MSARPGHKKVNDRHFRYAEQLAANIIFAINGKAIEIRGRKYEGLPHGLFDHFTDNEMILLQKAVESVIVPEIHDKTG